MMVTDRSHKVTVRSVALPAFGFIFSGLIITAFLLVQLGAAEVPTTATASFLIFSGILVVMAIGEIALTLVAASPALPRALTALLIGSVLCSIMLLALSFGSGAPTGTILISSAAIALPVAYAARRWRPAPRTTDWRDLVAALIAAIIISLWCRGFAQTEPILEITGRLHAWSDYYVHGAQLAEFGDSRAAGRGSIVFADYPRIFYHYGMYLLPSTLLGAVQTSGLAVATAVLTPLGLLLGLIASYLLASQFGGRLAGVLTMAGLTLLPDAAQYGMANGFYSFYWLLFTTPGAGFGFAACCIALLLLLDWQRSGNRATLVGALVMTAAIFQMRVHFLIWLLPTLVLCGLSNSAIVRRNRRVWLGSLAATGVGVVVAVAMVRPLREFWLHHSAVQPYINFIYRSNEPTAFPGLYDRIIGGIGEVPGLFAAALLLPIAAFGALLAAYPLALLIAKWRRGWSWDFFDSVPPALIVVFLVMVLYAPTDPWGDISEYQHRSFVMAYAILMIWTAQYLGNSVRCEFSERLLFVPLIGLVAVGVTALTLVIRFDPARPPFAWGKQYYDLPVSPGLVASARWIRQHPVAGPVTLAVGPVDSGAYIIDNATALASLTNIPTYLARAASQLKQDEPRRLVATERMQRMQRVETSIDAAEAMRLLREANITAYVWISRSPPSFDPNLVRADWHDADAAIYLVGRAPD